MHIFLIVAEIITIKVLFRLIELVFIALVILICEAISSSKMQPSITLGENEMLCNNCHKQINKNFKFCMHCGKQIF